MSRRALSLGTLLVAVVLFVAINILGNAALGGARVDLTEERLYTLSDGTRRILADIPEPIRLTLYYSRRAADADPGLKAYGTRVREVLEEYAALAGGNVVLDVVDPEPFSEAEDRAVQAGLAGLPVPGAPGERLYFGLVATNSTDDQRTIPFFTPERERFLEYDLTRLIYTLAHPRKKVVGLLSFLPMEGAPSNPFERRPTPAWQIVTQMKEVFDVRTIEPDAAEIPDDVEVLMLVHPKNLAEPTLYAIDQFVLRGGRLMVFVDPLCEVDLPPGLENQFQAMSLPRASNLDRLFDAWGVELVQEKIAADLDAAMRVTVGQTRPETVDYPVWLSLGREHTSADDPATGELQRLILASAGALRARSDAKVTVEPLLQTGPNATLIDKAAVQFMPDPKRILADYIPGDEPLTLAARLRGTVPSAFPDGPPGRADADEAGTDDDDAKADAKKPDQTAPAEQTASEAAESEAGADDQPDTDAASPNADSGEPTHLAESTGPINVIVVADCDLLADRFWVRQDQLFGATLLSKIADNADFVLGALDNLTGSSDLISIRARGTFARPFERVQDLQRQAQQQYRAKEQELLARLAQTQARINELQRQRPDAAAESAVLLTPEQAREIEKARQTLVETRKELRDVQHQLNKDIEALGTRLKLINIGLMPAIVALGALTLGAYRTNRRRTWRRPARSADTAS